MSLKTLHQKREAARKQLLNSQIDAHARMKYDRFETLKAANKQVEAKTDDKEPTKHAKC